LPEVARHIRKAALLVPLLLLLMAAAGAQRYVMDGLEPADPGAGKVTVQVAPGVSTREVADRLLQQHLIRDAVVFRYYARYRGLDAQIKPGEYALSAAMTPDQILQKMARGEVVIHRFTIPEGLAIPEIAERLAAQGVVQKERFLAAAAASHLAESYLPKDVHLQQPLEGYLFPSTYEYQPGVEPEQVLQMMFTAWEQLWTPTWKSRAQERGLTVHQALTLASIIEEEAQVAKERPVISGVYSNRLDLGMKLDADPTVRYAIGKPPQEELLYKDLEIESPYNTYRSPGLPPGPIAAPGKASIEAALYPEKHDFWYFVARADGSGEHYFATTLDEQDANIAKSLANAKK
jgi:UPF0755 protein